VIASDALQVAVFAALNGNVGAGVYDAVPQGAAAPYVVIGEGTERPWDTMTDEGSEETMTLHVWSRTAGSRQVKQVMAAVDGVLHDATLTLAGAQMVSLRREFVEVLKEPDAENPALTWRHGVMRYRTLLTEA
jgi:hypothetical protein